jgi:hypothetical protein
MQVFLKGDKEGKEKDSSKTKICRQKATIKLLYQEEQAK